MKIAIVTSLFPPYQGANAWRPYLVSREMNSNGHSVEVFTTNITSGRPSTSCNATIHDGIEVNRLSPFTLKAWEWFASRRIFLNYLKRMWPDTQLIWMILTACHLRKIKGEITVLAYINPVSMLLLPCFLHSRRFHFVFDYLESVTPFRLQVPYEMTPHRQLAKFLRKLEKYSLSRAKRAVFTSSENRNEYVSLGLCPYEKTIYIPHYSDSNAFAVADLPFSAELVITYVGYFNRDRSPKAFLEGLRKLLQREPESETKIRVNIYGNGLGVYSNIVDELGLQNVVNDCGFVDRERVSEITAFSHVLLLVTSPQHKLFFPSKVVEYIVARRPILALLSPESEVVSLLKESGRDQWICSYDNPDQVADCLSRLYQLHEAGELTKILPEYQYVLTNQYTPTWEKVFEVE